MLVGSCAGRFYGVNRHSGEIAWEYDTSQDGPAANFHGDPLVVEQRIVVGSDVVEWGPGHVYCFDNPSGRLLWKHAEPGGVISKIVSHGRFVYGVSKGGDLVCLRLSDGALAWRATPDVEATRHSLAYDVLIHDGRAIYSSVGGTVTAVDAADGSVAWVVSAPGTINTGLAIRGTSLWVGTQEGALLRIDARTGKVQQTIELEKMPYGTPVVLEESLVLLLDGNVLARISIADGNPLWQRTTADEWSSFRPMLHDGLVWVGNAQGELLGLSLKTGEPARTLNVDGTVRGFHIRDDAVYVGTLQGTMYALPPSD